MDDLTDYLILYFLITGVLSLILSSFFTDRKIGMLVVLGISLIFSPIIGLIVGLSSEKIKSKPTTKLGKFKHHKEQLLKKIELL
jgi:ABC-type transport system involved in multi-copper enzyme maturation permease subunit